MFLISPFFGAVNEPHNAPVSKRLNLAMVDIGKGASSFTMATLQDYIEAIEDNLTQTGERWSSWKDPNLILDFFAYEEQWTVTDEYLTEQEVVALLKRAIQSDGESLKTDLPAYGRKVLGTSFPGSFWDR